MKFGLMFFGSDEDPRDADKYGFLLQSARFADAHGFSSVWIPERHFTRLGSLYPNPSVLCAALARETRHLRLRTGSVVLPLHDPLRVAEEWAMVDNLSGGRVELSFASGWNPDDFAFFPERYPRRAEWMVEGIRAVQRLWTGETVPVRSGTGAETRVRIYPTPIQPRLNVWITAAGNPRTFVLAGELGADLLTHLLDQGIEKLAENVAAYRAARARAGHDPDTGRVAVMLHTFVGADLDGVRETVREPFKRYLIGNGALLESLAVSRGGRVDVSAMSPEDVDGFAGLLFERFFATRALIGTPESCGALVGRLAAIGVDEIACLLDFGPRADVILEHLPHLARLCARHAGDPTIRPAPVAPEGPPPAPTMPSAPPPATQAPLRPDAIRARCPEAIPGEDLYAALARGGLAYGASFQALARVWRRDGEALGELRPGLALPVAGGDDGAPALLEACVQVLGAAVSPTEAAGGGLLFAGLGSFRVHRAPAGAAWSHATVDPAPDGGAAVVRGDVRILDDDGDVLVEVRRLTLRRAEAPRPAAPPDAGAGALGDRLREADPATRNELVRGVMTGLLATVARLDPAAVDPARPLADLGIDSIMAIELKNRVEARLGTPLPLVLFLQDTTLGQLADRVLERVLGGASPEGSEPAPDRAAPSSVGATAARTADRWIQRPRPVDGVPRLFCLSYLAGGASAFRTWPALLGPAVEVCPIQLPGREDRLDEPPLDRMPAVVDALLAAIHPLLDRPYAFYGHSMGALIAFELVRSLRALGAREPARLIVANAAPHRRNPLLDTLDPAAAATSLPLAELRPTLRRIGVKEMVLDNAELMAALVPVIQADVRLVHGYTFTEAEPFDFPIVALKGAWDDMVSEESVVAWRVHTRGPFRHGQLAGGHLFLDDDRDALLALIRAELRPLSDAPGGAS